MNHNLQKWANENIIWSGNEFTNKSSRRNYIPEIIVNHITEGDASSCIAWFTTSQNKGSSAHFLVTKNGKVYQFVKIEDNAWGNGLSNEQIKDSLSRIVKAHDVNPNWYSVSVEHEGVYKETQGKLTDEQYESTLMLHKYIKEYVKDRYSYDILMDREHILGHYEVNPIGKPFCLGELYPFDDLIIDLNEKPHWAEAHFEYLNNNGITINEKRFDDNITRGEMFALLAQIINKI